MNENEKIKKEISATSIAGQPTTAFDMINKYGTYEIQPTSDTTNEFPAIAQGIAGNKESKTYKDIKKEEK